jgi:hypothetical protein
MRQNFRKEDRVAEGRQKRGAAPGLGPVFSAMEACAAFQPWHDNTTGKTGLRPPAGQCPHYCFYFLHARLGLVYVRGPTGLPFGLQIYFNGHNWLASRLRRAGLKFPMADNALVECADWQQAQGLADDLALDQLKRDLDGLGPAVRAGVAGALSGRRSLESHASGVCVGPGVAPGRQTRAGL